MRNRNDVFVVVVPLNAIVDDVVHSFDDVSHGVNKLVHVEDQVVLAVELAAVGQSSASAGKRDGATVRVVHNACVDVLFGAGNGLDSRHNQIARLNVGNFRNVLALRLVNWVVVR